jgi:hypothetical protein
VVPGAWNATAGPPPGAAGGQPPTWNVQPSSGGGGCGRVAIIILALLVLLFVVVPIVLFAIAGTAFFGTVGVLDQDGDDVPFGECTIISDEAARDVLGGGADAMSTGVLGVSIGRILDDRALATAEDCWIVSGAGDSSARVARYQGSDARDRYDHDRMQAETTSDDRPEGITVTREAWLYRDLSGVGDAAYCTAASFAGAVGAMVIEGDTVVFASIAPGSFDAGDYEVDEATGNLVSEELCQQAVTLAQRVNR